jgi:hypothetical protein
MINRYSSWVLLFVVQIHTSSQITYESLLGYVCQLITAAANCIFFTNSQHGMQPFITII